MTLAGTYARTPIPADARPRMRFVVPLWLAIVFSPFAAFAANGRVDDSNWTPALITAGLALFALVLLHVRARSNYLNLPAWHRAEYTHGKLFPASGRQSLQAQGRQFDLASPKAVLRLSRDGLAFSAAAWLGADRARRTEALRMLWHAARERRMNVPEQTILWRDIVEWQVHDGSEAADYYRVRLADGGHVHLHRPHKRRDEYELLDTVRSTGQTAVRLFCDIPRT